MSYRLEYTVADRDYESDLTVDEEIAVGPFWVGANGLIEYHRSGIDAAPPGDYVQWGPIRHVKIVEKSMVEKVVRPVCRLMCNGHLLHNVFAGEAEAMRFIGMQKDHRLYEILTTTAAYVPEKLREIVEIPIECTDVVESKAAWYGEGNSLLGVSERIDDDEDVDFSDVTREAAKRFAS
jgi:hypothetical protein